MCIVGYMNTAPATTDRTFAASVLIPGTRVQINDPRWYRHGAEGTVVKVTGRKHLTVRVRLDGDPTDITSSPIYLIPAG